MPKADRTRELVDQLVKDSPEHSAPLIELISLLVLRTDSQYTVAWDAMKRAYHLGAKCDEDFSRYLTGFTS